MRLHAAKDLLIGIDHLKWDETEQKCSVKASTRLQQEEIPVSQSIAAEVCEAMCAIDQVLASREQSINIFQVATPHPDRSLPQKRKQADLAYRISSKRGKPSHEITALRSLDGKQGRKGRHRRLYGCSEHLLVQQRSFEWCAFKGYAECSARCPYVSPPLALGGKSAKDLSGGLSMGSPSGAGQESLDLLVLLRECDDASTNGAVIKQEESWILVFAILKWLGSHVGGQGPCLFNGASDVAMLLMLLCYAHKPLLRNRRCPTMRSYLHSAASCTSCI